MQDKCGYPEFMNPSGFCDLPIKDTIAFQFWKDSGLSLSHTIFVPFCGEHLAYMYSRDPAMAYNMLAKMGYKHE